MLKVFKLLFLAFISICLSCSFSKVDGTLGASNDIISSKAREVFIEEFKVANNPYKINDSLVLVVKSAWLEHQWRYDGFNGKKSKKEKEGYQLILISDENSLKGYGENWMIGLTGKNSFRFASRDALIIDLDSLPKETSLAWKVQDSNQLAPKAKKNIIGRFSLIKKIDKKY